MTEGYGSPKDEFDIATGYHNRAQKYAKLALEIEQETGKQYEQLVNRLRIMGDQMAHILAGLLQGHTTSDYVIKEALEDWRLMKPPAEAKATNNPYKDYRSLRQEIQHVLNRACAENKSDTPDHILAQYLMDCLSAFDNAVNLRTAWYASEDK